ncbi:ATP-binding cassette domain-containing protein [Microbacterium sp. NEAU-LLC]|uniref:ATP-binding cassette domain-containing protein n=1 Tax=Microbacterium helvum TaxID=2773713 RepID=A0ABR8NQ00_9MICO|nr:ATP-binding cassette domain-containing protein [Microbacterium helvum]MBD3942715.1 ATP-binding cassette domain-containing protein [Microbacterium helvum]
MPPLLELRDVSRTYAEGSASEVRALCHVDLAIDQGEYVAIVGPSGGGKTTLLSILGMLDSPTTGDYVVNGTPTSSLDEIKRTRMRAGLFGFVFQSFHLFDRREVADSAELGLYYQGADRGTRGRRSIAALSRLGLGDRQHSLASDLSGGQRQRVAIARAIATENRVILADEPTGNLDRESGAAVMQALDDLHSEGATVVVVTHSDDVARHAQRVVRIADGEVIEDSKGGLGMPAVNVGGQQLPGVTPKDIGRIRMTDRLRDAMSSLGSRRSQTAGLIVAVAVAVALIIVSLGIGASARAQVSDSFDAHANREVTINWQEGSSSLTVADAVRRLDPLVGIEHVAGLADHGESEVRARSTGDALAVTLRGATDDVEGATSTTITSATRSTSTLSTGQALVGRSLARQLELAPLELSPAIEVDGSRYTVVGIVEDSARYPLLAGQVILSEPDAATHRSAATNEIAIVAESGAAPQIGKYAALALDPIHPDGFVVTVPVDPQTLRVEVESGVQVTLLAFTALAVLVAAVTLANALTMSVLARTGEFGLRRAVGARPRQLAGLVALEAAIVGLVGGTGGLVLGVASLLIFTITQRWLPVFDVRLAPLAVIAGLSLAMLSSIMGASRAARISPVAALRS